MTASTSSLARLPGMAPIALRAAIARSVVHRVVAGVPVRVRYPNGQVIGGGTDADPMLDLLDPGALYRRLARHPKIGLGEAYTAGEWRAAPGTDLAEALVPFAQRLADLIPPRLLALRGLVDSAAPQQHRPTPENARDNISAHYDLSNELFAAFLDASMTYSSALFADPAAMADEDLHEAQLRKIDRALDAALVGRGTRLLEIGTGWGALAVRAAERGAQVTTITLSQEQASLAQDRVAAAGQSSRVRILLQDYREASGHYDAIVSIEMIEAVGEDFWPDYFQAIYRLLAPGGHAVIQSILMSHRRYLATRHSHGWIQEHIFPGGLIPSLTAIDEVTTRHTGLRRTDTFAFGLHYAETLRRWRHAFAAAWPGLATTGFEDGFRRTWEFYLAYCEAGFASGYLDLAQFTLRRT